MVSRYQNTCVRHFHKLPNALLLLINDISSQNIVGFGRTPQQQLECLLNNLLATQTEVFRQQLKNELLAYYHGLSADVVNR